VTPDEIIHAYTAEHRSMWEIAREARINKYELRALLVEAGVTIRRPGALSPERVEESRRRSSERAGSTDAWPSADDHRRHVEAVYAACPWGFDLEAGRRALAGRGINV
jgi:hypothetical protein